MNVNRIAFDLHCGVVLDWLKHWPDWQLRAFSIWLCDSNWYVANQMKDRSAIELPEFFMSEFLSFSSSLGE